jgi:hypothetical protein
MSWGIEFIIEHDRFDHKISKRKNSSFTHKEIKKLEEIEKKTNYKGKIKSYNKPNY